MLLDFTKKKFDIIITAGQSNCEGSGIGEVEFPYQPKDNVWMMTDNRTRDEMLEKSPENFNPDTYNLLIERAKERIKDNTLRGRFFLHFADNYLEEGRLQQGRELLVVQTALGGTGFANNEWGKNEILSLRMFDMVKTALSLNKENKIVAFLWHQGEHDVSHNTPPQKYYEDLNILLSDVKKEFGSDYPFISGDFVPEWKQFKGEQTELIANESRKAFENIGGYFVTTENLTSNNQEVIANHEKVHFSRKSLKILGDRYYDKFKEFYNK